MATDIEDLADLLGNLANQVIEKRGFFAATLRRHDIPVEAYASVLKCPVLSLKKDFEQILISHRIAERALNETGSIQRLEALHFLRHILGGVESRTICWHQTVSSEDSFPEGFVITAHKSILTNAGVSPLIGCNRSQLQQKDYCGIYWNIHIPYAVAVKAMRPVLATQQRIKPIRPNTHKHKNHARPLARTLDRS